jgi:D-alanyl-D-alanine carboxypeptidase/D-alanyl-D-alanine-endopeptidase (penicillin-binding protein 4)
MILLRNVMLGVTVVGAVCGAFCEAISPVVSVTQQPSQAVAPAQPKADAAQADRAYPASMETVLGERIAALLADPAVSHAHWGIAVTAMDGTPLYGLGEGEFFRPASVAKLYTTARVDAEGEIDAQGVLHGDLVLVGGGDAMFASSVPLPWSKATDEQRQPTLDDIDALAAAVAAKGITRVTGDVIGDERRFEHTPYPQGWAEEDMLWGYGAPVSALTVHDNQVELTITPAARSGSPATIAMMPSVPFYRLSKGVVDGVRSGVLTQDFGHNQVLVERAPGSRALTVVGDVAPRYGVDREELAIDDPALYGAEALSAALEKRGIQVAGGTGARRWDSGFVGSFLKESTTPMVVGGAGLTRPLSVHCESQAVSLVAPEPTVTVMAVHTSPPLSADVMLTLKMSENLHAEIMMRNLAAERDCEATLRRSLQMERTLLTYAGLSGDDFVFFDGSGLSAKDLVTPRATAQLLAYAARQSWFPQWKAALPVGGVDGTLSSRFRAGEGVPAEVAALQGKVFAKTGTLGESRALAGYVEAASGKTVIFSIMVDNHAPGSSADRVAMDKIVAAIAAAY